jgi:predicted NBD/HSP70 family sugar kinase
MIIGVDLATLRFELAVADAQSEIQQRKRSSSPPLQIRARP